MHATQTLPENYHAIGTLDISKDQRFLLILNVFALIILAAAGVFFFRAIFWLRGDAAAQAIGVMQINTLAGWAGLIVAILALTALHVVIHEAIHGVFFWLYTRSRPKFAFRWAYAYAAAPSWFIPRNAFFVTTLAPLVVISLAGLLLMSFVSPGWLLPIWYVITMNAAGAVGDLAVGIWLLRQPPTCLAQDRGDAVTLFLPS